MENLPIEQPKPWWQSKTILINLVAGVAMVVAQFYPGAAEFLNSYFSEFGAGWAIVNVLLRLITKKEIA